MAPSKSSRRTRLPSKICDFRFAPVPIVPTVTIALPVASVVTKVTIDTEALLKTPFFRESKYKPFSPFSPVTIAPTVPIAPRPAIRPAPVCGPFLPPQPIAEALGSTDRR